MLNIHSFEFGFKKLLSIDIEETGGRGASEIIYTIIDYYIKWLYRNFFSLKLLARRQKKLEG